MNFPRLRRLALATSAALMLCMVTGCDGDPASITFLDLLNTVFLGITAAGGLVLIRNL